MEQIRLADGNEVMAEVINKIDDNGRQYSIAYCEELEAVYKVVYRDANGAIFGIMEDDT